MKLWPSKKPWGFESRSTKSSSIPENISSPDAALLRIISVSEDQSSLSLNWSKNLDFDFDSYQLYGAGQSGGFNLLDEFGNAEDTAHTVSFGTDNPICFYVTSTDNCGNVSPDGIKGCYLELKLNPLNTSHFLYWNDYVLFDEGSRTYIVEQQNDDESWKEVGQAKGDATDFDYGFNGEINFTVDACYRLKVQHDSIADWFAYSNTVCGKNKALFYVPNAFSPDGDGLNEEFAPEGLFIQSFELEVYGRNGQRVYYTNESESWNGFSFTGRKCPVGTYLYILRVTGIDGEVEEVIGNVTIIGSVKE